MSTLPKPVKQGTLTTLEYGDFLTRGMTVLDSEFYLTSDQPQIFKYKENLLFDGVSATARLNFSDLQGISNDGVNIWTVNTTENKLYRIDPAGNSPLTITTANSIAFADPFDVKIHNGVAYVADTSNLRICSFDASTGDFLNSFATPGATIKSIYIKSNLIYAADVNGVIRVYSLLGVLQDTIGTYGTGYGEFESVISVVVDGENRVWAADAGGSGPAKVVVLDLDGNVLTQYSVDSGSSFNTTGPFSILGGNMYMTDTDDTGLSTVMWIWNFSEVPMPKHHPELGTVIGQGFGYIIPGSICPKRPTSNSFLEDVNNRYKI